MMPAGFPDKKSRITFSGNPAFFQHPRFSVPGTQEGLSFFVMALPFTAHPKCQGGFQGE
jgi:hypothetical protein